MTIQIDYNRSEKMYQWTCPDSGEIFQFPSGKQGKAEAWKFAISMLDPELHETAQRMIERQPTLERTIWRAVELVANNAIEEKTAVLHMVSSSDEFGRYAVENGRSCQCEAFTNWPQYTSTGAVVCKHVLSVYLFRTLRTEY